MVDDCLDRDPVIQACVCICNTMPRIVLECLKCSI